MQFIKNNLFSLFLFSALSFSLSSYLISSPLNDNFYIYSYLRGIPLAEGNIKLKLKSNKYSIALEAKSTGIFSLLLDWSQIIKSYGNIEEKKFKSLRYRSSDIRGKKNGHIEIDFTSKLPKIISAQPDPSKDKRRNINISYLSDVNDPAAGIFNLALAECENTAKIFDGKRRYNIKVLKKENSILKNSALGEENINTINCSYKIERIAGYTKKELEKFPKEGNLWIKKHKQLGVFYPVKIQINTKWGYFLCLIKEGEYK